MSMSTVRDDGTSFENVLRSYERRAWQRFRTARREARLRTCWTGRTDGLAGLVMPTLRRIGFRDKVSRALFGPGSGAWRPSTAGDVALLHPNCTGRLADVRRGVVQDARERSRQLAALQELTLAERDAAMREWAHPVHLQRLLGSQSTSWLVLPRTYDHLQRRDVCHLLHYVEALRREDDPAFQRVLARVLVEFVGNYAVKYARGALPHEVLVALSHAYEALFWRNLRKPAPGSENALAFEAFLSWIAAARRRGALAGEATDISLVRMHEARDEVFPPFDAFGRAPPGPVDVTAVAVCLRHGEWGVQAVLHRFAVSPLFETETLGRLPFASVPVVFNSLHRRLARTIVSESPSTRRAIRSFFGGLHAHYRLERLNEVFAPRPVPDELRFVAPRLAAMSRELSSSPER